MQHAQVERPHEPHEVVLLSALVDEVQRAEQVVEADLLEEVRSEDDPVHEDGEFLGERRLLDAEEVLDGLDLFVLGNGLEVEVEDVEVVPEVDESALLVEHLREELDLKLWHILQDVVEQEFSADVL